MINKSKFIMIAALAMISSASSAYAQSNLERLGTQLPHRTAHSSRHLYMYVPEVATSARDAAIHDCSVKAGKGNLDWGTWNPAVYGACMGAHNQQP